MNMVAWYRVFVLFWGIVSLFFVDATAQRGAVRGQVTDAETGEPVVQANVMLQTDGETTGTSTDTTGAFQLRLAAGEYDLEVSALGYEARDRSVVVRAGETSRLSFVLVPRSYSLNEIVVQGRAGESTQSTSTVQRVEPRAIEQQDAADVSELAPLVAAAHAQTNSRGQTILYFRNAGDRQVGQFFDGALLNIPWDNRVDISLIPASVVEDITVTKGVPSVRYGANVLGGAINFQSRTLSEPGRTTEVKGALGTSDQHRATVTHLGRTDHWDYTAALQYSARGEQPLPSNANLEYNQPSSSHRVNTDRRLSSGFGRVSYRSGDGSQLALSLLHVDAEQGVAPEGNKTPDGTRYWRYPLWQKSTMIASGKTTMGTSTSLRGAAWGSRFAQDIADYESIEYDRLASLQEDRDLTAGVRLIGTQNLSHGTLSFSLNGLTSRHEKTNIPQGESTSTSESEFQQHLFSGGVEYETQVHSRVEVSGGGNLDGTATPKTGPFPERDPFHAWGVTSGIQVDLTDRWGLRGAAGRKSRFPTMRELFGAALGKFVPNPNLKPVTAWIGEIGVEYRGEQTSVEVTPFLNRVYDTIGKTNVDTDEGLKVKRINLQGARVYGIESAVSWRATEALQFDGNATWSRPSSFTETGTQKLDEKPGWLATGRMTYDLSFGLSMMGQARYTGNTYARFEEDVGRAFGKLPSSLLLDARFGYDFSPIVSQVDGTVYVRGDNLTDDAEFIGRGLPGPGRSFQIGIDLVL